MNFVKENKKPLIALKTTTKDQVLSHTYVTGRL